MCQTLALPLDLRALRRHILRAQASTSQVKYLFLSTATTQHVRTPLCIELHRLASYAAVCTPPSCFAAVIEGLGRNRLDCIAQSAHFEAPSTLLQQGGSSFTRIVHHESLACLWCPLSCFIPKLAVVYSNIHDGSCHGVHPPAGASSTRTFQSHILLSYVACFDCCFRPSKPRPQSKLPFGTRRLQSGTT